MTGESFLVRKLPYFEIAKMSLKTSISYGKQRPCQLYILCSFLFAVGLSDFRAVNW